MMVVTGRMTDVWNIVLQLSRTMPQKQIIEDLLLVGPFLC